MLMRPLTLAGIFAAVSNFSWASQMPSTQSPPRAGRSSIQLAAVGLSEAAILPFAAFACLTVGWFCVAIGMRKQP